MKLNQLQIFNKQSAFCTLAFLISLFFQRIFIGELGHNYIVRYNYPTYTHIFECITILLSLFFLKDKGADFNLKIKTILRVLLFFLGLQVFYHYFYHLDPLVGTTILYDVKSIRLIGYLTCTLIFTLFFFNEICIEFYFSILCKLTIYFSLFSLFLYYIANSGFQLNLAYNYPRIQGFTTEPSGLAPILAYYLIYSIIHKNKSQVILTILCIFCAKSPTVYITCSMMLFLYFLINTSFQRKIVLCCLLFGLIYNIRFLNQNLIDPYLKSTNSVVFSLARLASGFTFITSNGSQGENTRYKYALQTVTFLKSNHLLWTGYGLNSASAYFKSLDMDEGFDSNIFLSILFFYGIIGCIIFMVLVLNAFHYFVFYQNGFSYIFISYLIATTINAAGGFISYKILIVGLTIPLLQKFIFNFKLK